MKKLICFIALLVSMNMYSQDFSINDIPDHIQYIEVTAAAMFDGMPPLISLDYGQKGKTQLKLGNSSLPFNSVFGFLNWIYGYGFELKSGYVIQGTPIVYKYVLVRKKE